MRNHSSKQRLCGVVVLTLWACDPSGTRSAPPAPMSARAKPKASTSAPTSAAPPPTELTDRPERASKPRPPKPLARSEKDDAPVESSRYVLDELNDIGPAGPAAAFARGVVMVTRDNELLISRLLQPPSKSKKPTAGEFAEIGRSSQAFFSVARGPAVSPTHVYWITKGRLVRRALSGGELEVLSTDAREGTRVAVVGPPDVVAYITEPVGKQDSLARLRLSDGRKLDLTPEGAAASSVSLARVGEDVIASYIDGRSGMTPVHARKLRSRSGTLDPDVVVWVSGATQGMTEITSVGTPDVNWLMLPVERDASHFGLATLAVDKDPKMDPPLRWRTYENGLDRSPVASGLLCGEPTALYVRPQTANPEANQELVISSLSLDETASSEPLATARGFADVSIYPVPEGGIVAYVADRRTWARLIRCK
ncbi:MAG: hypothetical protein EOO73_14395 [Myxococcales bacterium]|nr:MAG: hypothetical protein EOO73_14395 [Myxococcales bacterium]